MEEKTPVVGEVSEIEHRGMVNLRTIFWLAQAIKTTLEETI